MSAAKLLMFQDLGAGIRVALSGVREICNVAYDDQNDSAWNSSEPAPGNPDWNVVSLTRARVVRQVENEEIAYQAKILGMDKIALLEEMIRFQEERTRLGKLTLPLMIRGKHLFRALEKNAETEELLLLARSYRRHLEFEIQEHRG